MKSRCSSVMMTQRRPFLRLLATILSVVLLIVSLGLGSLISVHAINTSDCTSVKVMIDNNSGYTYQTVNGVSVSSNPYYVDAYHGNGQYWEAQAVLRVKKRTQGDSEETTWYKFKYQLSWSSGGGYYSLNSYNEKSDDSNHWVSISTSDTTPMTMNVYNNAYDSNCALDADGYGYKLVTFKLEGNNNSNDGYVNNRAYAAVIYDITASYTNPSENLEAGHSLSVYPSISNGSGSYNVSYSLTKDGAAVTDTSAYIQSNTFKATVPGVYVVTTTVSDAKCPISSRTVTKTITVTGTDWHIVGLEDYGEASVDATNKMTPNGDGTYSITVNMQNYNNESVGSGNGKFGLQNKLGDTTGPISNSDFVIKEEHLTKPISMHSFNPHWFNIKMTDFSASMGYTITFDPEKMTLTVTPTKTLVYAKDGASRGTADADTGYNYGVLGTTAVSAPSAGTSHNLGSDGTEANRKVTIDGTEYYSKYQTLTADVGDVLTVTTTIETAFQSDYYIKALNVNGESYLTTGNPNTFTLNYTVKSTDGSFIEITPVYYLRDATTQGGSTIVVTYYMDGFSDEMKKKWGNMLYAYPFYGTNDNVENSFGAYPGQPFIYEGGKYSVEIPVESKTIDTTKTAKNGVAIKGITVSCGALDAIHTRINGFSKDRQTYDSDGFIKAYNEMKNGSNEPPKYVYQSFRYRDKTNNRETYGGEVDATWGYTKNTPVTQYTSDTSAAWITEVSNGNGWELYTDKLGRPIDLFGKVIENGSVEDAASAASGGTALRVISSGYIPSIAGDYGSSWLVYIPNGSGQYDLAKDLGSDGTDDDIYAIPPSVFMFQSIENMTAAKYPAVSRTDVDDRDYTDSIANYTTLWTNLHTTEATGALGKYVYISYESNQQNKHSPDAYRVDTRWYYTFPSDVATSTVAIEYSSNGVTWTEDSTLVAGYLGKNNQGNYTGSRAYFTNTGSVGETSCEQSIGETYTFEASAGTGYIFKGWYSKDSSGNYSPIYTDGSSSGETTVTASETLVARFIPISDGYLTISHNPAANNDTFGSTSVRVKVFKTNTLDDANLLYDSGAGSSTSVTLTPDYISNTKGYYLQVTLTTTPSAPHEFNNTDGYGYDSNTSTYTASPTLSGSTNTANTSTFSFPVISMFAGSIQNYNALSYTSTFIAYPIYHFSYTDRDGVRQSYDKYGNVAMNPTEVASGNLDKNNTRAEDISNVLDTLGIVYFKKNIYVGSYDNTDTKYLVNVNCTFSDDPQTLTYYYPNSASDVTVSAGESVEGATDAVISNTMQTGSVSGSYGTLVNLASIVKPYTLTGKVFYAWCDYTGGVVGNIVSTSLNFDYAVTKTMQVVAVYADSACALNSWGAYIDDNGVTKSMTSATSGYFYNDTIARFTNYATDADVTSAAGYQEAGILVVYRLSSMGSGTDLNDSSICGNSELMKTYIGALENNQTKKSTANNIRATKLVATNNKISNKNRVNIVLKTTYESFKNASYAIISYVKINNAYHLSAPVYGTYGE